MRIFFAHNTSDQGIINRSIERLIEIGLDKSKIEINYNTFELQKDDLFISYEPPDLVIRRVYERKDNGMVKMKSDKMLRL